MKRRFKRKFFDLKIKLLKLRKKADIKILITILSFFVSCWYYLNCVNLKATRESLEPWYETNNSRPIVFIGGIPRSGSNLMREIFYSNGLFCTSESSIIGKFFSLNDLHIKKNAEGERLEQAGITRKVVDAAASTFILELIQKSNKNASNLCYKDLVSILYAEYLSNLYPNAKFILLIRDGRATVNSIISQMINYVGFNDDLRNNLINWNELTEVLFIECMKLGLQRCLPVFYEQLVLYPEREVNKIAFFLKDTINVEDLQIKNPKDHVIFNLERMNSWIEKIPLNIMEELDTITPMLKILGYNTYATQNYIQIDRSINEEAEKFEIKRQYWIDRANISKLLNYKIMAKYF